MTSNKIKVLVVENEPLAREEFIKALNETDEFDAHDFAETNAQAYNLIVENQYDLIFLDITLSDGICFSLINKLKSDAIAIPPIVIVTGRTEFQFPQKIFNEYGNEVIYILNKPFWSTWIENREKIISEYFKFMHSKEEYAGTNSISEFITIPSGRKSYYIKSKDIIHIKTGEKGKGITEIFLWNSKIQCNLSLIFLINKLPKCFVQINRYEIINMEFISFIEQSDKEVTLKNGYNTIISPNYYKMVENKV